LHLLEFADFYLDGLAQIKLDAEPNWAKGCQVYGRMSFGLSQFGFDFAIGESTSTGWLIGREKGNLSQSEYRFPSFIVEGIIRINNKHEGKGLTINSLISLSHFV
jgi:hypothetical protein